MSLPTPNTRKEQYLNAIATGNAGGLPTPINREEVYLDYIAKNGGGGTTNYNALDNKPQIAGTTLQGNKSLADLGIASDDAVEDIYAVMGEMGAKNLISYPYKKLSTKVRGITWSDNGDGGIVGNGTGESASSQPYCEINGNQSNNEKDILLKAGKWYVLTCKRTSEYAIGANIYFLDPQTLLQTQITYDYIYDDGVQLQRTSNNIYMKYEGVQYNKVAFKLPQDMYAQMQVRYEKGTNVSVTNDIQYPMLRLASDTDDTYQQYAKTNKQLTDEIANKVDKVEGKGLSTNDYDDTEKGKVADNTGAIEAIVNEYGAKNELPNNAVSDTVSGVTFTVNADKTVTANGTATDDITFMLYDGVSLKLKDHLYSGCPLQTGVAIGARFTTEGYKVVTTGATPEVALIDDIDKIYISIVNGTVVNNLVFKPMIRDARIKDPTYVPYAMTNSALTDTVSQKMDLDITKSIGSSIDLDNFITPGNYSFVSTSLPVNKPSSAPNTNGHIVVQKMIHNGNITYQQDYYCYSEGIIYHYVRRWFINSWSDWIYYRTSGENVSVTGDGVKTIRDTLYELYGLVDRNKLNSKSVFYYKNTGGFIFYLPLIHVTSSKIQFGGMLDASNTDVYSSIYILNATLSDNFRYDYTLITNTITNESTSIASASMEFGIVY